MADKFGMMAKWMDDMTRATGVNSLWLNKALQAGRISTETSPDEVYRIAAQMAGRLPAPAPENDIRALIRYGTSGPGVPVQPPRNTGYTPDMQGAAIANGMENVDNIPRVSQKAGELIPSPIDPRRFTMGDVPPGTGYTPEMIAEATGRGIEIPIPRQQAGPIDIGVRGLPGPVATPEQLAQIERARRMYQGAAGRADDVNAGPDLGTALIVLGGQRGGMPSMNRGSLSTVERAPSAFANALGQYAYPAAATLAAGAGAYATLPSDTPNRNRLGTASIGVAPNARNAEKFTYPGDGVSSTGGTADLAEESRPAPKVEPTPSPAPPAVPPQQPITDLSPEKQQTFRVMVQSGISPQRAQEIVRGKYSLSPNERNMILRSGKR